MDSQTLILILIGIIVFWIISKVFLNLLQRLLWLMTFLVVGYVFSGSALESWLSGLIGLDLASNRMVSRFVIFMLTGIAFSTLRRILRFR